MNHLIKAQHFLNWYETVKGNPNALLVPDDLAEAHNNTAAAFLDDASFVAILQLVDKGLLSLDPKPESIPLIDKYTTLTIQGLLDEPADLATTTRFDKAVQEAQELGKAGLLAKHYASRQIVNMRSYKSKFGFDL